jgi:hypothetical protein
VLSR